jgi:hypothetical protein
MSRPNRFAKATDKEVVHPAAPHSIGSLTALRRVQHKPDPLLVSVDERKVECTYPDLPLFQAAVINVDAEQLPLELQIGGDYRTGRFERWRFEVKDKAGKYFPIRTVFGFGKGGGLNSIPFNGA